MLKAWLGGASVYGPIGIVMATVYAAFPHALMILIVALATADGRLYEAADALELLAALVALPDGDPAGGQGTG